MFSLARNLNRTVPIGAAVLVLVSTLVIAPSASAADTQSLADTGDSAYLSAKTDDLINVRIGDVHPTQPSLGYDEVYYKLGRYTQGKDEARGKVNKKFDDWCEANGQVEAASAPTGATLGDPSSFECAIPEGAETADSIAAMKTVVIGPGGSLYLTDGHHTLTSFAGLAADGGLNIHVRLRVLGNLSNLSSTEFWNTMIANKWTWLTDAGGRTITPAQLPTSVGLSNFQNDVYRSLLYFGRDIGYSAEGGIPFQEFYWGDWLKNTQAVSITGWDTNLDTALATVKSVTEEQIGLDKTAPVSGGFTADDLGALAQWNDGKKEAKGTFGDLSQPYSADKPGKLAYMLQYRQTVKDAGANPDQGAALISQSALQGTLSTTAASVAPGQQLTVVGTGIAPKSVVDIELHSDPVVLATVVSDDRGGFRTSVTIPADTATTEHQLVATVAGVQVSQNTPTLTVAAGGDDSTGDPTDTPAGEGGDSVDNGSSAGNGSSSGNGSSARNGASAGNGGGPAGTGNEAETARAASAGKLAHTGIDEAPTLTAMALGLGTVALGAVLAVAGRRRRS